MESAYRSAYFLALPLEGDAKAVFGDIQARLEPWAEILSFQPPQSPHLTLSYWSNVSTIEYAGIVEQSKKIAAGLKPFSVSLVDVGTFGKAGAEHVLFLKPHFSPALADAKKRCPWPSPYPDFNPHVTLARIKHPQRFGVEKKKILKAIGNIDVTVHFDRLRFYANVDGRPQTPLEEFRL